MTDPNELIVQLIGCLPMIDEGPDHKLWCSVRGDWLRAAVAALTPAPAQPEPPTAAGVRTDGAPAEIWLQLHGDGEPDGNPVDYRDEVSWCWEKIHEHDVRYVLSATPPTLTDAQCDATKDAERYRWLRQFSYPLDGILEVLTTSTDDQPPTHLYGDYLDAAIDRALIRAAAAGAG